MNWRGQHILSLKSSNRAGQSCPNNQFRAQETGQWHKTNRDAVIHETFGFMIKTEHPCPALPTPHSPLPVAFQPGQGRWWPPAAFLPLLTADGRSLKVNSDLSVKETKPAAPRTYSPVWDREWISGLATYREFWEVKQPLRLKGCSFIRLTGGCAPAGERPAHTKGPLANRIQEVLWGEGNILRLAEVLTLEIYWN